jgi:hypothetical protein
MRVRGLMSVKDGMPDSGWLAGVGRLMTALLACVVVVGVWGCSVAWGAWTTYRGDAAWSAGVDGQMWVSRW